MTNSINNKSLYIHIPFCEHLCPYCDFTKLFYFEKFSKPYLDALFKEIDSYHLSKMETIYIGGGTPTSLSDDEFEKLLKKVSNLLEDGGEFTCEANVENLTRAKLEIMARYGVNRLSIGIQSSRDERLSQIGRFHTFEKAKEVVSMAHSLGFNNINVDLMYGFPGQTLEEIKEDVKNILKLNTEHVSIYSLIVSPGTLFFKKNIKEQNQDDSRLFYDTILQMMRDAGFERYEISNFSKPGFKSRHNLVYWHNKEYCGVGLGASGYLNGIRYKNTEKLDEYLKGNFVSEKETVDQKAKREYFLMTHLRLKEGFSLEEYKKEFGTDFIEEYKDIVDDYKKRQLAVIQDGNFAFTDEGLIIMDSLILPLF